MKLSQWSFCYLMLAPIFALFGYIRIYPIVRTFIMSFYKWDFTAKVHPFIGFANYVNLMSDPNFRTALLNTTWFSVATVILSILAALPLSVILSSKMRGSPLYQAIYFAPYITPMVPIAVAWKWIYDPSHGILNYLLSLFNINPVGWLIYPNTAMWAIIVMSVWKAIGYNMVLFMVGINNIPKVYFEAGRIDGSNGLSAFRYITLPLLRPILLFVVITSTINAFNVFTQVYVMTLGSQSAPGNALRVLVYDIYQNGFSFFKMGYASAEAVILTIIVLGLTVAQLRTMRGEDVS